jgi:hypothetical protein
MTEYKRYYRIEDIRRGDIVWLSIKEFNNSIKDSYYGLAIIDAREGSWSKHDYSVYLSQQYLGNINIAIGKEEIKFAWKEGRWVSIMFQK